MMMNVLFPSENEEILPPPLLARLDEGRRIFGA